MTLEQLLSHPFVIVIGIAFVFAVYYYVTKEKATPPSIAEIHAKVDSMKSDVKALTDRVQVASASAVERLTKLVEDLHTRWDKDDESAKKKPEGEGK